jgi:hypothetical protein
MYCARMMLGLTVILGLPTPLGTGAAALPVQAPSHVGSWRLVSAKSGGQTIEFPQGTTILKHVTPTHFVWVHYDRNGQITQAGGGSYVVSGDRYDETPEYGLGEGIQPLIGKRQSFTVRIAEDRWYQGGKETSGVVIEEIWERLAPAGSPQ